MGCHSNQPYIDIIEIVGILLLYWWSKNVIIFIEKYKYT